MCWAEKKQPEITNQCLILGSILKPDRQIHASFISVSLQKWFLTSLSFQSALLPLSQSPASTCGYMGHTSHITSPIPAHLFSADATHPHMQTASENTASLLKNLLSLNTMQLYKDKICRILLDHREGSTQKHKCCGHFASSPEPVNPQVCCPKSHCPNCPQPGCLGCCQCRWGFLEADLEFAV